MRSMLVAIVIALAPIAAAAAPSPPAPPGVDIGLLLLAVDAKRDHLRVSEALRLSNTGPARTLELRVPLPEGAAYLAVHRGIERWLRTAAGFTAVLRVPAGISEVAYSYALPSGRTAVMVRSFPLRVQRLEVVARGRGVGLELDRGGPVDAVLLGAEALPRWEVRALPAGEPVTILLDRLPVSHPWLPAAGASGLAVVLGTALIRHLRRGPPPGEETSSR